MVADLRFALRALRRSPGFVLAAVLCLGLGANAMVYAVVDGLLLRPLPFADAGRLVAVQLGNRATGGAQDALSRPYFLDLRARSRSVRTLAAYVASTMSLDARHGSDAIEGARVSAEFFAVLGTRPLVGRGFRPDESAPGAPPVTVFSETLWRDR